MKKSISEILKKYREINSLNQYELSILMNCNISTIRKIEGDKYNAGKKLLYSIFNIKNLDKEDKKYIKTLIDEKISAKEYKKKKNSISSIEELLQIIEKLKKENDILINNKIMTKEVNTNKDFFKFMSFESDYETTNRIIKSLWELNDESAKYFSELKLLLSINSSFENIKIKKGITTVAKNLRDMSDTLLHYLNKKDDITIE